jgi:putative ABC transport system permease protein
MSQQSTARRSSSDWRDDVRRRLSPLGTRPEREMEIVEEIASQLEAAYIAALSRGAPEADAVEAAAREVPDWDALAADLRRVERPHAEHTAPDATAGGMMSGLAQDVRYAVRSLRRAPGFAAIAIVTLALGIAAAALVFSLADGILIKPLPIADPDRVVLARELTRSGDEMSLSWPNFQDWQARARSFESLAAWRGLPANLTGTGRPRRIMVRQVTWNLFHVMGVTPALGRPLATSDDQPGVERVCLISHGFWLREFGGDPNAIGRRIVLDEVPVTVVGVLPPDFTIAREEDAFLPFGNFLTPGSFMHGRGNHFGLAAIGRLRGGVTVDEARAEVATIAGQLAEEYPATNSGQSGTARLLTDVLVSQARPMLLVLLAAVAAVLLIACVNLANLLLARASSRAQEMAVRRSLGANRWRIVRQLVTESLLVGISGGVLGIGLAWLAFEGVVSLMPTDQPRLHTVGLDARVIGVAVLASLATGLLFGLAPAAQAAMERGTTLLRGARVTGAADTRTGARRLLLFGEVALALVLVSGAGLMVRTMANLAAVDPGFDHARVVSAQVSLPSNRYDPDRRRAFVDAVVDRLRALPGASNAAFTYSLPVAGSNWNSVFIVDGQPVPERANLPSAAWTPVSPSYFDTMGVRLVRGRLFDPADAQGASRVAVVNESFARRFWPGGSAVGGRIKQGWPEDKTPWREVVGVVTDVKTSGIDQDVAIQAYLPFAQEAQTFGSFVVRTAGDPAALRAAIEPAIQEVDPNLPVYDVRTMDEVIGVGLGRQRLTMVLLMGFSALALVIAGVGVFGVTAYAVAQRRHEMGVRLALGASPRGILSLVVREELGACVAGVVAGVAGALLLATTIESLLFGVAARDPVTLGVAAVLLLGVTAVASYLPARSVMRIDPAQVLRME